MSIIRVVEKESVKPFQVVLVCLVLGSLAGSFLLTSGPHGTMEGARDWHEESLLRAVIHVLNLAYTQTTSRAIEIKWLVFAVGAGLAAVVSGVAMLSKPTVETAGADDTIVGEDSSNKSVSMAKRQIPPLAAAQIMMICYALWSFASASWSHAPDMAIGGSVLLAIGVLWALVIGRGLSSRPAIAVSHGLLAICTIAASMAIAYHDIRNPTQRVGYPIGNPLFLAACLLPGLLGGVHMVWTHCRHDVCSGIVRRIVTVVAAVVSIMVIVFAIKLTGSRSAVVAAIFGFVALYFFESAKRGKIIAVVVATIMIAFGVRFIQSAMFTPSDTGRDATLRTRVYAWSYAQELIQEKMFLGHGQGGYTLLADRFAREDVLADAMALEARIAHAHNEWIETWVDLGIIGLAFIASSLVLTLMAGVRAVRHVDSKLKRGTLISLLAILVALAVEECADNALRVAGLPIVFYTVIGLIWAMSRNNQSRQDDGGFRGRLPRSIAGVTSIVLGLACMGAGIVDFQASRDLFEIESALSRKDHGRAEALASTAARGRLGPQRRIEALERKCATQFQIARNAQVAFADRLQQLTRNPDDPSIRALVDRDRQKCLSYLEKSGVTLSELLEKSPEFFSTGWRGYQLHLAMVYLAETIGDTDTARKNRDAAAQWLRSDLVRRPFDPMIAVNFVDVASDKLTADEMVTILARPLRYNAIPDVYGQYLASASANSAWIQQLSAIGESVAGVINLNDTDQPWAPEKLRILADVYMINGNPALAAQLAMRATKQYESIPSVGLIGPGASLAESADYQYLADPHTAESSLTLADAAAGMLPNSTPGRQLKRAYAGRAIVYCLAAGREDEAIARMKNLSPNRSDAAIKEDLASAYAAMTRNAMRQSSGKPLPMFETWITRATVLSPEYHVVWWVNAQVQFALGKIDHVVESLQRAVRFGGDRDAILEFAVAVREQHPDHVALTRFILNLQGPSETNPSDQKPGVEQDPTTPVP